MSDPSTYANVEVTEVTEVISTAVRRAKVQSEVVCQFSFRELCCFKKDSKLILLN